MNCINCINPIYKLVEYLNTQITSETTDITFLELVVDTLATNSFDILKQTNTDVCCPDCPDDDCNGGTYFLGGFTESIVFATNYISGEARLKVGANICCINTYTGYDALVVFQEAMSLLDADLPICCNDFSNSYLNNFLLAMQTYYDADNDTHIGLSTLSPYLQINADGIFEYSLFQGNSALGDILTAAENLPQDSFKFTLLMYLLNEGLVITCEECAAEDGTIKIMTNANFIANCLPAPIL